MELIESERKNKFVVRRRGKLITQHEIETSLGQHEEKIESDEIKQSFYGAT